MNAVDIEVSIQSLTLRLREFAEARDWDQFHSPRNLASALIVEAGEVLEHFQWLTDAASVKLDPARREQIALELADVLLYLIRLADKLEVDVLAAANRKMDLNAEKYPIDKSRGSAKKYTEL